MISMALDHRLMIHSLLWFPNLVVSDLAYSVPPGLLVKSLSPIFTDENPMVDFQAENGDIW